MTGHTLTAVMAIMLLTLAYSCKTTQITTPAQVAGADDVRYANNKDFDCCTVKLRASVGLGGRSLPATGVLSVKDGEWMSCSFRVPLLGIEMVRVEAGHDTLVVINRYDRSYVKVPMSDVTDYSGLTYESMQSLVLGDFFTLDGERPSSAIDVPAGSDGLMTYAESDRRTTLTFAFDTMSRVISASVSLSPSYTMTFGYSDFFLEGGRYYPGKVEIKVSDGQLQASLDLTCNGIDFSPFVPSPTAVSSRYKEIALPQILSSLHF